jgi:hypothetical protein
MMKLRTYKTLTKELRKKIKKGVNWKENIWKIII